MKRLAVPALCSFFFCMGFYSSPSFGKGSGPETVFIEGGCFEMGDTFGDGEFFERPVHKVCLDDFRLGEREVTNKEFAQFLNEKGATETKEGEPLINLKGGWKGERCRIFQKEGKFVVEEGFENHPVLYVSWYGAKAFVDHYGMRLPTEAEWEFAAREGGKKMKYTWGDGSPTSEKGANIADLSVPRLVKDWKVLNWTPWPGYDDNFPYTAPVASFQPNALGLYDMAGNVWEWCEDYYHATYYKRSPEKNPLPADGETHVVRGGSWLSFPVDLRLSARGRHYPYDSFATWGFRVAKDAP